MCRATTTTALTSTIIYLMSRPPPLSTLFPYTTLFRSIRQRGYGNLRTREGAALGLLACGGALAGVALANAVPERDRKSTRLNSSHSQISYAVFCLKKKTTEHRSPDPHSRKHRVHFVVR